MLMAGFLSVWLFVAIYRVQVFNKSTGQYIRHFGSPGSGNSQFQSPYGVAIDGESVSLSARQLQPHCYPLYQTIACFAFLPPPPTPPQVPMS